MTNLNPNVLIVTLAVVVVVLLVVGIPIYILMQKVSGQTISSSGQATIKAMPDEVGIYVRIETRNKSAQIAKDENAEISDAVLTELIKLGLERSQISTQSYNEYPEYNWDNGKQEIIGYVTNNQLKVLLKNNQVDKAGSVVDEAVNNGGLIDYISYELSDVKQSEYKKQALEAAASDAKEKAEATAAGLGKRIGKLVSVSGNDFGYNPWPIYARGEMATTADAKQAATNILPSEQEVTASVSAVFRII